MMPNTIQAQFTLAPLFIVCYNRSIQIADFRNTGACAKNTFFICYCAISVLHVAKVHRSDDGFKLF